MLSYISRIFNNSTNLFLYFNTVFFNKSLKNHNPNKTYSFFFKNFFNYTRVTTLNLFSLQKINYLTLHTASAGR
jgi:hypothetical protein